MKKIVLAITEASPRDEALKYSLGLAQRLKARLEVLQVLGPSVAKGWRKFKRGLAQGGRVLESTMATAAFAEAGVDYEVTTKVGDPAQEIVRFVEDHPDVVLAVLDTEAEGANAVSPEDLGKKLAVPAVAIAKRPKRGESMGKIKLSRKNRMSKLTQAVDRYQEAVTFAEANLPVEAVASLEPTPQEKPMILVMGRDHTFSRDLKDYALGLAGRLGYDILAVNTRHIPGRFSPEADQFREHLRQDFSRQSEQAARDFEAECQAAGICFKYDIKFGESSRVMRDLHREHPGLEYVLTEPDDTIERPVGVKPAIPVFSMVAT
jgi:hypothetical protein